MNIVKQSAKIVHISHPNPELFIEDSARMCYNSHDRIEEGSAEIMIKDLRKKGHNTPMEFVDVVVDFVTNRAISHQMVRHRLASILQQSQRYVRYDSTGVDYIEPVGYEASDPMWQVWERAMTHCADSYVEMLAYGAKPQRARGCLPNDTATKLRFKANIREWLHIFSLRDAPGADPQMIDLMSGLHAQMIAAMPTLFGPVSDCVH